MTSAAEAIKQAMDGEPTVTDGRRARSLASRRKIIAAMVDLIAEGNPNPSAALVAEKAGVGVRSVFRNFDDKDSIFCEIDQLLFRVYGPRMMAPFASADWEGRLFELIERRMDLHEGIEVFRVATLAARYRSNFLRESYLRMHVIEKRMLDDILPASLNTSTRSGRAILLATSFDNWRLLRQDEMLSQEETGAVIRDLVRSILDGAEA